MRLGNYLAVLALGACISLAAVAALWRLAEPFEATATPEGLADLQARTPNSVVLPVDLRYNLAFKIRRLETTSPDIVWFATSRAGSAMAHMFKPTTFYNMAFTGWTTDQLAEAFERSTRHVRPRVAIVSLDYFLFTDRWESQLRASRRMILNEPLRYLKSSLGVFARNAVTHWSEFQASAHAPIAFIGPQTMLTQEGFRQDGSWLFTDAHIASARNQFRNLQFLIDSLPGGAMMSTRQKAPIERLAQIARQRGIKLVAVQLPYLRAGVDFLNHQRPSDEFYGVWHDFESSANRSWLRSLGIELFDLSHSAIDDDPDNFIDAYHPSERGMQASLDELMTNKDFRAAIARQPDSGSRADLGHLGAPRRD